MKLPFSKTIQGVQAIHARLFGRDEHGNDTFMPMDAYTPAVPVIEALHYRIHQGVAYRLYVYGTLAGSGTRQCLIRTGPRHLVHLRLTASAQSQAKIDLYEGPTVTNVGTPHLPICQNRYEPAPLNLLSYVGSTVSADGTLLSSFPIMGAPSQGGKLSVSGVNGENDEWLLKNGTDYLLRLTNEDTADQLIYSSLLVYEQRLAL